MVKFLKNNLGAILAISLFVLFPLFVSAQATGTTPTAMIKNPLGTAGVNSLTDLLRAILQGIIKLMIPVVAIAIIYSGFLFVTAQGNTEQLTKAKHAITFSLIGAALVLGAWALAQLISETVLSL